MKAALAVAILVAATAVAGAPTLLSSLDASDSHDLLECEDLVEGQDVKVEVEDEAQGLEREMEIEAEADTRVRIEVEVEIEDETADDDEDLSDDANDNIEDDLDDDENESSDDDDDHDADDGDERKARVEICGFVHFVDEDGDGVLTTSDTIVDATLVEFDGLEHRVEGGEHVFLATSSGGNTTVEARVPEPFPAADVSLIRWTVEANPTCAQDATHYAVKLRQRGEGDVRTFLIASCGSVLQASGQV